MPLSARRQMVTGIRGATTDYRRNMHRRYRTHFRVLAAGHTIRARHYCIQPPLVPSWDVGHRCRLRGRPSWSMWGCGVVDCGARSARSGLPRAVPGDTGHR